MHTFYDMIQIMERDRGIDEDWKKWAFPLAVAAGSVASGYRALHYPTKPKDRPAKVERLKKGDGKDKSPPKSSDATR